MECNFSHKHYCETLIHAKKEYAIGPVRDFKKLKKNQKCIILRHDVDVSMDQAYEIAKKEAKYGLCSTYFILFHSPYYNAFDENSFDKIQKISSLGHEIGLHYDVKFLTKISGNLLDNLKQEISILAKISNSKITSIAQHDPTYSPKLSSNVSRNFLDVNNFEFNHGLAYISDSVQNWRLGCMCQHVGKEDKLQILTHPIWWSRTGIRREQIWKNFVDQRKMFFDKRINQAEKFYKKYLNEI